MPDPASKDELQELNHSERAALAAAVERMGRPRLDTPVLDDGWSVKDVLAHINVWERRIVRAIEAGSRGGRVDWPEPGISLSDHGALDALNARDFESHRSDALDAVITESQASFDALIECVDGLPDDVVMRAPSWRPQIPLFRMIGANAWEHYREHIDQIDAWLAADASHAAAEA